MTSVSNTHAIEYQNSFFDNSNMNTSTIRATRIYQIKHFNSTDFLRNRWTNTSDQVMLDSIYTHYPLKTAQVQYQNDQNIMIFHELIRFCLNNKED